MTNWIDIIVSILSGLTVCIPLVVQLIKWVKAAIQEKNWSKVMQLVLNLMTEAEKIYQTGEERKEYVLSSVEQIKGVLEYEVDMKVVSEMVDAIVLASHTINAKVTESK